MQKLYQINHFVEKHFPWFVLCSVCLGVLFPDVFSPLKSVVMVLFAFMTFDNSLGGGFRELASVILPPLPVLVTLLMLHVIMPLLVLGLGNLLFPDAPLFTIGLVLEFSIPTAVASLMWVAIPALIGITLYQITKGGVSRTLKPALAPFSKLTLLVIVIANSTGCASFLRNLDRTLVLVMAVVFLMCLFGFFAGYWAGKLFRQDFPTVETMCLNIGMRNNSAGAVLAMQYFPADVLFPVAFTPVFLQLTTSLVVKVMMATPAAKVWRAKQEAAGTKN